MRVTRRGWTVLVVAVIVLVLAIALPLGLHGSSRGHRSSPATGASAGPTVGASAGPTTGSGSTSGVTSGSTGATAGGPVTSTAPPAGPGRPAHSLSDPSSIWVVVDKRRPLQPVDYAPTGLASVGGGQYMRQPAADALLALLAAASTDGLSMHADSGYRSYSYQVSVHGTAVANLGQEDADVGSARPGYSEHQTGWAVDVGGDGCEVETCFGATPDGRWLAANAYRFGFLIRYPQGLQAVTGYEYEPWHIRYVGPELAGEMHARGVLTLERWFGLPAAPTY